MFVGRSREIVEVLQWVGGDLAVMVVCGLPGVGKSSLCAHVLGQRAQIATVRLDAQHWVGDVPQAMMHALGGALHVSWEGDEEILWAYLRDSPHLILVENAESVAPLDLYAMLTHTSWQERGVRWLCTTRVLEVPEHLPCVHLGGLSQAHERTSARLILQGQLGDGLASELDDELLRALLDSLEYHPLSLMLCGQMMRWLGQELVARRLIDSVHGGVDEHIWPHKRLDEVFASLWGLLDDETRELLGRLCVMPQPVVLADVWLLCASVCDVQRACEQACRYGGLMHEGESLRMPQAWRTYCASHFRAQPARYHAWLGQLTRHYLRKHEDVWTRWSRLDELEPLERLRGDRQTLRWLLMEVSGLRGVEASERAELGLIVCVAHMIDERLSQVSDLLREEVGEDLQVERVDAKLFVQVELLCQELVSTYDEHVIARLEYVWKALSSTHHKPTLELSYMIATHLVFARILRTEMPVAQQLVEHVRAQEHQWGEQGLWVPEAIKARFEMRVATLVHQQRQLSDALPLYQDALVQARSGDDRRTQAMIGHNLGVLYTDLCELDKAHDLLMLSEPIRAFQGRALNALNLLSVGMVWLRRGGHATQARQAFGASAEIMTRTKLRGSLGVIECNLGMLALDQHDAEAARHHLELGRRALHMQQDVMLDYSLSLLECDLLIWEGMYDQALDMAMACHERCAEYGDAMVPMRACFAACQCLVFLCQQKPDEASALVQAWTHELADRGEPFLESIWAHLDAAVWLLRSREGKVKQRQAAWLEWLTRARALSELRARRPSESSRFVLSLMARSLLYRESNYWSLFCGSSPQAWAGCWVIDERSGVVMTRAGQWIDLSRSELLRSLLSILVAHQGEVISSDALQRALWPDERMLDEAANNRMHVALSKLRALGLSSCLERQDEGYVLDPEPVFLVMK